MTPKTKTGETETGGDDARSLRDVLVEARELREDARRARERIAELAGELSAELRVLRDAEYRAEALPLEAEVRARIEGTRGVEVGEIDVPDPDDAIGEVRATLNRARDAGTTARVRRRLEVLEMLERATDPDVQENDPSVRVVAGPPERVAFVRQEVRQLERGVPGGFDGELGRLIDAAREHAAVLEREERAP